MDAPATPGSVVRRGVKEERVEQQGGVGQPQSIPASVARTHAPYARRPARVTTRMQAVELRHNQLMPDPPPLALARRGGRVLFTEQRSRVGRYTVAPHTLPSPTLPLLKRKTLTIRPPSLPNLPPKREE